MVKKILSFAAFWILVVALFSPSCHATGYFYNVPEVRGMMKEQAESTLKAKGYEVIIVEIPADNYTQVGRVVKQDPPGGGYALWVKWSKPITLSVAGKGGIVPDTLLKTEAEAIGIIKNAGYVPKVEYYVNETQGMAGKVWTTNPLPYRNHPPGGTVVLQVAKPGQAMENFVGKHASSVPQWTAEINRIKSLGLKATVLQDKTTYVPQEDQKVYTQTPAPGAVLVAGSEIKVSAYKYIPPPPPPPPPPTPFRIMPNVVGKSEKDATALITSAGMKVSVNYIQATQQNQGTVTAQSVPAGSRTAGPIVLTVAPLLPPPPPPPPAKPAPMTIMPGFVGQTEQDATAFLTKAGLKVSVKYVSAPKEKQGRVTAQSVPANTRTAGPVVLTVGSK